MIRRLKQHLGRRFKNSQQGQSIILLAFGFIALAAFVGLVTDISIMFVRFSTLRRAVDAASVAAAGQVREGTDYGTVALTARQYIVLHGLQPHRVWVETCETDIAEWRKDNPEITNPSDPNYDKPVSELMPKTELCNWDDPRKLVRVVAQIDSQTTFLKLLGIDDFVITASSVSETAVLDVALVLDTSKSMAEETTQAHFTSNNMFVNDDWRLAPEFRNGSNEVLQNCIAADEWYDPGTGTDPNPIPPGYVNFKWGGCCNDPGYNGRVYQNNAGLWVIYTDGTWDGTSYDGDGNPVFVGADGNYGPGDTLGIKHNLADNDYSDLLCEPFKQVKDAARNFIMRLDFVRGDRVALVTFDTYARIIPPNNNVDVPAMMTSEVDAIRTLNVFVGVDEGDLGEQNYDCDGHANPIVDVRGATGASPDEKGEWDVYHIRPYSYAAWGLCANTNIGDGILWAAGALTNPDTIRRNAVWVAIILTDGAANAAYTDQGRAQTAIDAAATSNEFNYLDFGFCPWYTFCDYRDPTDPLYNVAARDHPSSGDGVIQNNEVFTRWQDPPWSDPVVPSKYLPGYPRKPGWEECYNQVNTVVADPNVGQAGVDLAIACNDNNPLTRHFCLQWSNDDTQNAKPIEGDYDCTYLYDADDYARDMADFAGLIDLAPPNINGNFIAMFTIGFGQKVSDDATAAPLLRYIADAGDNGFIDNNLQQDWRDNGVLNYGYDGTAGGGYPPSFGPNDPCAAPEFQSDPKAWCGQYYYAENLSQLDAVFEAIASRLFTRIAR